MWTRDASTVAKGEAASSKTLRLDVKPPMSAAGHPNSTHEPVCTSKGAFGQILQRERQQRGISLDDVARDTHLARRYLLALENESLDDLPGGPYNRAYLRTYAEYLGLDENRLLQEYDLEAEEQCKAGRLVAEPDAVAAMRAAIQRRESQTTGSTIAIKTTARTVAFSGAVLAVLVGTMWIGARQFTRGAETLSARVSSPPASIVSNGGKKVIEASAMAPLELAPRTDPGAPQSDPEPVVRVEEVAAAVVPPDETRPATSLLVKISGVGTDVVDRQLVGRADTFAIGTRVAFWMLVTGGRPGDTVRHVWVHQGQTVGTVNLPIGTASWRTQSRRMLAPGAEGDWIVEAHDAGGRVLARHAFRCER